ncbi:hypothetical protein LTR32_004896, partial [Rachicladosporium monterosium]
EEEVVIAGVDVEDCVDEVVEIGVLVVDELDDELEDELEVDVVVVTGALDELKWLDVDADDVLVPVVEELLLALTLLLIEDAELLELVDMPGIPLMLMLILILILILEELVRLVDGTPELEALLPDDDAPELVVGSATVPEEPDMLVEVTLAYDVVIW